MNIQLTPEQKKKVMERTTETFWKKVAVIEQELGVKLMTGLKYDPLGIKPIPFLIEYDHKSTSENTGKQSKGQDNSERSGNKG